MGQTNRTVPTPEEFFAYRERFNNWGRWGDDDALGTLNHITDEVRRSATQSAMEGQTVSLANPIGVEGGPRNPMPAQHLVQINPRGSRDYIGLIFHGRVNTHIDAFCHFFSADGHMYNGVPTSEVTSYGANFGSIDQWRQGIVTRGVLYDVPRLKGVKHLEVGDAVHSWDLADAAEAQGIEPRAGDAVLVRSGKAPFYEAHPDLQLQGSPAQWMEHGVAVSTPGVHASALEFLYDTDAALLGWDFLEASNQGYPAPFDADPRSTPVHEIALPHMGLPLLDNMALEEVAEACAARGRWDFLFVVAPLVITGGTGSPVNPLAIF